MKSKDATFELARANAQLFRDGTSNVVRSLHGEHGSVDGFTIGAPHLTRNPPHGGERHPDGDELLFLISGRIDVLFDEGDDTERTVELSVGRALVVPRGVFHRIHVHEPSQLLHITPGPGAEYRPRRRDRE